MASVLPLPRPPSISQSTHQSPSGGIWCGCGVQALRRRSSSSSSRLLRWGRSSTNSSTSMPNLRACCCIDSRLRPSVDNASLTLPSQVEDAADPFGPLVIRQPADLDANRAAVHAGDLLALDVPTLLTLRLEQEAYGPRLPILHRAQQ